MTHIYYRKDTGGKIVWDIPDDLEQYGKQAVIDAESVNYDSMTQLENELPIEVTIHQSHDIQSQFHSLLSENNIDLLDYVASLVG